MRIFLLIHVFLNFQTLVGKANMQDPQHGPSLSEMRTWWSKFHSLEVGDKAQVRPRGPDDPSTKQPVLLYFIFLTCLRFRKEGISRPVWEFVDQLRTKNRSNNLAPQWYLSSVRQGTFTAEEHRLHLLPRQSCEWYWNVKRFSLYLWKNDISSFSFMRALPR